MPYIVLFSATDCENHPIYSYTPEKMYDTNQQALNAFIPYFYKNIGPEAGIDLMCKEYFKDDSLEFWYLTNDKLEEYRNGQSDTNIRSLNEDEFRQEIEAKRNKKKQ